MVVVLVLQVNQDQDANRGAGGTKYNDGALPAAGILPSGATGGKIESCTTGGYWNTQGFSPCSDIGQQKFVLANGQINNSTQTIQRGYKAADVNSDYGFRHNGGNSQVIGANGLFVGGGGAGVVVMLLLVLTPVVEEQADIQTDLYR